MALFVCKASLEPRQTVARRIRVIGHSTQINDFARVHGAERVIVDGGTSVDDRVIFAFRSVLNRRPNTNELQSLTNLYEEYLSLFRSDPESAAKFLSAGESPRNDQLDPKELAAWSMVTHLLLNLSETVTKG